MSPIRKGDGTGLSVPGVSEVRTGDGRVLYTPAIPDSEANQKLANRWVLDDVGSGSITDSEGSSDGTNNGIVSISGEYAGGAAGDGRAGNYIDVGTLDTFGSSMDTDFAWAFSIDNHDGGDSYALGASSNMFISVRLSQTTGFIKVTISDANGDTLRVETDNDVGIADGSEHRIVINKVSNSNIEIWVDQSQQSASVVTDQGFGGSVADFNDPIYLFDANNLSSSFVDVIDDVCRFGDSLTQTEIQSYDNPWA